MTCLQVKIENAFRLMKMFITYIIFEQDPWWHTMWAGGNENLKHSFVIKMMIIAVMQMDNLYLTNKNKTIKWLYINDNEKCNTISLR